MSDEATESLGSYLRSLREAKGGSLEEMARATRVGASRLRALESEQFSELPAPVFIKGFIRAYCEFLGEKPDEALARYQRLVGQPQDGPAPAPAPRRIGVRRRSPWSASPILASLVLLVVFGLSLVALSFGLKQSPSSAVKPADMEPAAPVERGNTARPPVAAPAGVPTVPLVSPPVAAAPAPERAARDSQRLVVRALEPTWMRVQTDDGRVVEELLQPGATREWTSPKRFVLTIGNAGGIELELNGRRVPRLGDRGVVIRGLELPPAGTGS